MTSSPGVETGESKSPQQILLKAPFTEPDEEFDQALEQEATTADATTGKGRKRRRPTKRAKRGKKAEAFLDYDPSTSILS